MTSLRRSTEKKSTVISRLNLVTPTVKAKTTTFVYVDGVPHKLKNGVLVPLIRVVKEEVIVEKVEENEENEV
jgi:hypothetical protein